MIKRFIPNLITLCNLGCGVLSVYTTLRYGYHLQGAILICLGIVFDFFDGMAARLLGVSSPLGKELDSLADVVTSGLAPCFIVHELLQHTDASPYLAYVAFLIPLFAAYRLAKFNLDTRQGHSFLGLPAPSQALVWVGVALSVHGSYAFGTPVAIAIAVASLLLDVLMVTELPMFSLKVNFKDLSWHSNAVQYIFLVGCAALIVASRQWYALSLCILWYIILSAITQRKHAQ